MVAQHDLLAAHQALSDGPGSMNMRLLLIRHIILEIANVADLAAISGSLYQNNPDLGELHKLIRKPLEFFKYLRNVYVGHFSPGLTDKTFEWLPYANELLGSVEPNRQLGLSWFALETAINTYADVENGHKVFESDTDLNYPPDQTRFFNFLGETAVGSISYVSALIAVAFPYVSVPSLEEELLRLSTEAGKTDFSVLTKGKR